MPAATLRRKNLKPEDRRNQILDAAGALFAEKGYEATTITDVMDAAGVSKGGFYHHFDSKEALLEGLAIRFTQETLANIAKVLEDDDLDPFCKLDRVLRQARAEKAERGPEMVRMFGAVFHPGNGQLFERVRRAGHRIVVPVLTAIIEEGAADGTFNVPDSEMAAHLIMHLNGAIQDVISDAMFASEPRARAEAREKVLRMGRMQGITIDRLLGLPDGSLVWLDKQSFDAIMPPNVTAAR